MGKEKEGSLNATNMKTKEKLSPDKRERVGRSACKKSFNFLARHSMVEEMEQGSEDGKMWKTRTLDVRQGSHEFQKKR